MNQQDSKKEASLLSLGSSSDEIVSSVAQLAIGHNQIANPRIFDIGCGQGHLLSLLQQKFPAATLMGCDYSDFSPGQQRPYQFFTHDCNRDFPENLGQFDVVVCSEVIEHLENGRHFWRQIARILKPGGVVIVSTPNIESITSILSFALRGYHSAFGGKAYPAHITAVSSMDMHHMIAEAGLQLKELRYIPNGRMPGLNIKWRSLLGKCAHRWFADNYVVVASNN